MCIGWILSYYCTASVGLMHQWTQLFSGTSGTITVPSLGLQRDICGQGHDGALVLRTQRYTFKVVSVMRTGSSSGPYGPRVRQSHPTIKKCRVSIIPRCLCQTKSSLSSYLFLLSPRLCRLATAAHQGNMIPISPQESPSPSDSPISPLALSQSYH